MTLENLLAAGQLKEHPVNKSEIRQLLDSAQRNLVDAGVTAITTENRFDAAYKTIMQASLAALMAHGYRPDTRGHHQLLIQALPNSIGLSTERMVVLDALRRKRNHSDYSGAPIDENSLQVCIDQARLLLIDVELWLKVSGPG